MATGAGWAQRSSPTNTAQFLTCTASFLQIRTGLASVSLSHSSGSGAWPALSGCVERQAVALLSLCSGSREEGQLCRGGPGGTGAVWAALLSMWHLRLEPEAERRWRLRIPSGPTHG